MSANKKTDFVYRVNQVISFYIYLVQILSLLSSVACDSYVKISADLSVLYNVLTVLLLVLHISFVLLIPFTSYEEVLCMC